MDTYRRHFVHTRMILLSQKTCRWYLTHSCCLTTHNAILPPFPAWGFMPTACLLFLELNIPFLKIIKILPFKQIENIRGEGSPQGPLLCLWQLSPANPKQGAPREQGGRRRGRGEERPGRGGTGKEKMEEGRGGKDQMERRREGYTDP